jgi:TolB-like protein
LASDAARDRSIAVLPLANLSGDKSDDYFGIGLAEEMTRALSKTGVRVIGRVSAGALQAKGLDERAIAKELGVGSLLTGSVQRAAGQLRINVSLIAAADGAVRWTEKYDRPIANVCAMQDEIATAVARKLLRSFGGGAARATKVETADPEAYALFLQAQALFGRRNFSTLRQAIALYGKAVARDPAYARAQASLAVALSILPSYAQVETDSIVALARAAALKAIAIDSTIPEAYTGLAVVSQTLYANRAADQYYRRSLALDSTLSTTWGWYGLLANRFGNSAEAHQRIARARELEPASLIARIWDAQVDSIARVVLERDSTFQLAWDAHGEALLNLDRTDEALAALEHSVTLQRSERPTQTEGILVYVYAYARAGRAVDARRLIASLKQRWGGKRPAMAVIAAALDLLGNHDAALETLQRSLDEHDGWLLQYTHMNRYDRLRTDPRAAAMLAKTEAP